MICFSDLFSLIGFSDSFSQIVFSDSFSRFVFSDSFSQLELFAQTRSDELSHRHWLTMHTMCSNDSEFMI